MSDKPDRRMLEWCEPSTPAPRPAPTPGELHVWAFLLDLAEIALEREAAARDAEGVPATAPAEWSAPRHASTSD